VWKKKIDSNLKYYRNVFIRKYLNCRDESPLYICDKDAIRFSPTDRFLAYASYSLPTIRGINGYAGTYLERRTSFIFMLCGYSLPSLLFPTNARRCFFFFNQLIVNLRRARWFIYIASRTAFISGH